MHLAQALAKFQSFKYDKRSCIISRNTHANVKADACGHTNLYSHTDWQIHQILTIKTHQNVLKVQLWLF